MSKRIFPTTDEFRGGKFVALPENRFARTALQRLREPKPRAAPPMVFLYGPAGVGKSHLLRWFVKDLLAANDRLRIQHLSAADLVEAALKAIDKSIVDEWQDDLQNCDYLLCEDLPAIRRHPLVQRLLATVVDEALANGARIVFTAPTPPGDIDKIIPRLLNRCRSATLAEVSLPGIESRKKLIAHFAQLRQLAVTDSATAKLAEGLPVSPRELLATVNRLQMLSAAGKVSVIRLSSAEQFLNDEIPLPKTPLSEIARAVTKQFGVSLTKLRSESRQQSFVQPRQCAMYLSRRLSGKSFAEIARYYRRKNHSTVVHACQRFSQLLVTDLTLNDDLHRICVHLGVGHHLVVDNSLAR